MSDIKLVQNDTGPDIIVTIIDNNSNVIDISNHTVRFKFRSCEPDSLTLFVRILSYVTDGTDGKVKIVWTTGDLATPGRYEGELEVTDNSNGKIQTVAKHIFFVVRHEFPDP